MKNSYLITLESWDKVHSAIIRDFILHAPIAGNGRQEYQAIREDIIYPIHYSSHKQTTLLKTIFLPFQENEIKTDGR